MKHFSDRLLGALRDMDQEAGGFGLWSYGQYRRPDLKKPQTELEWSKRIAQRLDDQGYPTERERPYPGLAPRRRHNRCDLVVTLRDGRLLWLEVKGAWKDYWEDMGSPGIYRSYLFHPLVPAGSLAKTHSAALDLVKLGRLRQPVADLVGLLLIAFDKPNAPIDSDLKEFERLARIEKGPWTAVRVMWKNPNAASRRVHVRLWIRPV